MADNILALNIEKNSLSAVLVLKTGEVTEILACGFAPIEKSLAESLETVLQQIGEGITDARCLVSIGGDVLGFHTLTFPFSSTKKIEQVIELELEEQTTFDLDSQAYDFTTIPDDKQGCSALIATVNREYLLTCIRTLQSKQLDPEKITVSGLSIAKNFARSQESPTTNNCNIHLLDDRAILIISVEKKIIAIRHIHYDPSSQDDKVLLSKLLLSAQLYQAICRTLLTYQKQDPKIYNLVISGDTTRLPTPVALKLGGDTIFFEAANQPFLKISAKIDQQYIPEKMDEALALAINYSYEKKTIFNFRKGSLAQKSTQWHRGRFAYTFFAALLVAAVILGGWAWSDYQRMSGIKNQLQNEIVTVFSNTLPEVQRIIDPVQQLQVRVNQMKGLSNSNDQVADHSMRTVLSQLSDGISPQYTVILNRIIADESTVRIKGIAKDFNTVDNIQKDLNKLAYFDDVTISSANLNSQADDVRFELKLSYAIKP